MLDSSAVKSVSVFKLSLAEAFVQHYSRMAQRIATQSDDESLANRVIHISVQLLSNEALAAVLVEKHRLTLVIVACIHSMIKATLVESSFHCKFAEQNVK